MLHCDLDPSCEDSVAHGYWWEDSVGTRYAGLRCERHFLMTEKVFLAMEASGGKPRRPQLMTFEELTVLIVLES